MTRIGLIFPPKKLAQAGFGGIVERARSKGVDLVLIDLDIPLEQQGPFALVVHKLNETFLGFMSGEELCVKRWNSVQAFISSNPTVPFLDPLASIQPLYSRTEMATKLAQVCHDDRFHLPTTTVVTLASIHTQFTALAYPIIIKRVEACSTHASHIMAVVAGPRQLDWLMQHGPFDQTEELTVQPIVQHGGVLFKAYTLAERTEVLLRPSLKDEWLDEGEPLVFDSQTIAKRFPSTQPTEIEVSRRTPVESAFLSAASEELAHAAAQLDSGDIKTQMNDLAARLSSTFNLTLFGFDCVLNISDKRLYIVDINYFPSFSGVSYDFQDAFLDEALKHCRLE